MIIASNLGHAAVAGVLIAAGADIKATDNVSYFITTRSMIHIGVLIACSLSLLLVRVGEEGGSVRFNLRGSPLIPKLSNTPKRYTVSRAWYLTIQCDLELHLL